MLKKQCFLVFLVVLIWGCQFSIEVGFAEGEGQQQMQGYELATDWSVLFPEERIKKARANGYEVKYAKYKPGRYSLGYVSSETSFVDPTGQFNSYINTALNRFVSIIWQSLLIWDFTVVTAIENSFSLDVVSWFADAVEKAVQQLAGFNGTGFNKTGIWGNFLLLIIICGGAYLAYLGMVQKKTTAAINAMIKSLIILMAAMVFFANAGGVMSYLNDLSSGLSQELMGVGLDLNSTINDELKYPDEVASFAVADKIYNMLIYQPYLMLQYGKTKEDNSLTKERIEKLLSTKAISSTRNDIIKGEKNNAMMGEEGVTQRLILLGLLAISHIILGFVFFIIAGAVLVFQFLFVIFALYAPFALLMAMYPTWSGVAMNWMKKFVGFQITKLILGIFLSILVTMSQFLYGMAPPEKAGYIWTIAMQLILMVGIIWKRKELFSILSTPVKADGSIRDLAKKLTSQLSNTSQRIQKFTSRS